MLTYSRVFADKNNDLYRLYINLYRAFGGWERYAVYTEQYARTECEQTIKCFNETEC